MSEPICDCDDTQRIPVLIKRQCAGWLAVAQRGAKIKFGVTGDTEEDALSKYDASLEKWLSYQSAPTHP